MSIENETAAAEEERVAPSEDAHFLAQVIGAAGDRDGPGLRRLLLHLDPADIADVVGIQINGDTVQLYVHRS